MKTFLEYVAEDIIAKHGTNLTNIVIVFPNKRASLFMDEYLAHIAEKPIWSPAYMTISDLFRQHSKLQTGDDIKLICDLYKTFIKCTGLKETLDHFYGWGQLLLADFDDIDKNMADAEKVFANIRDIHELDDISYLDENQKFTLKRFFSNFNEDQNTKLKEKFIMLWSKLHEIYKDFNERLEKQGIAYEGALYRNVIQQKNIDFHYDTYIFVGFNLLQKVEQELFSRLKNIGKALFYWDADSYYLGNKHNEAGHFINQYLPYFPNELDIKEKNIYSNFKKKKDITYISATTENVQARYVSQWLREGNRIKDGRKTVIVLCDESLLPMIMHQLPQEVTKANITTGYPLAGTPIASLIERLMELQTYGKSKGSEKFRLHYVNAVLCHPFAKYISEEVHNVEKFINEHKRFYPSQEELSKDNSMKQLFESIDMTSSNACENTIAWIKNILKIIGTNAHDEENPLFQESLFRMYKLINRLSGLIDSGDLKIDTTTLQRLIVQLIQSTNIPFHGEPAEGIQIMGVLETRNLDFEHVLMLSCNDGKMPKTVIASSFIPYSIRKAYGLTTIDNKVAVFAYYFHRLLQRASDITLTYNTSTENGTTGEMSRFMLQLLVESGHNISRQALMTGIKREKGEREKIIKNDEIMNKLLAMEKIYPTDINRYMRCQLQFYYNSVLGIKEPNEDDDEEIDARAFGNIFHKSAELIYKPFCDSGKYVNREDIEEYLKHPKKIEAIVDQAFREELFKIKDNRFQPEYNGLRIINRAVILKFIHKLLSIDIKLSPFRIKGLEKKINAKILFNNSLGERSITIGGIIDRLDEIDTIEDGLRLRVIDYKTGHKPVRNSIKDIEEIFSGEAMTKAHTDYYLQAILYSLIVSHDITLNKEQKAVSPALLFIQSAGGEEYDPTLLFGKDKIIDAREYYKGFKTHLQALLADIFEPEKPFIPTEDKKRCDTCQLASLCMQ